MNAFLKDIVLTSESLAQLEPVVHLHISNYCFRAQWADVLCESKLCENKVLNKLKL
jgi:hypothetical protein